MSEKTKQGSEYKPTVEAQALRLGAGLGGLLIGGTFFPGPRVHTTCGPCKDGVRTCITTQFVYRCETLIEGQSAQENPLGIATPPVQVCGWEMEILDVTQERCPEGITDVGQWDKIFLVP